MQEKIQQIQLAQKNLRQFQDFCFLSFWQQNEDKRQIFRKVNRVKNHPEISHNVSPNITIILIPNERSLLLHIVTLHIVWA